MGRTGLHGLCCRRTSNVSHEPSKVLETQAIVSLGWVGGEGGQGVVA